MPSLGRIVRKKRESMGLTVTEVARKAGMTKSYLSMIENDRLNNPPSVGKLKALERVLGIAGGELRRVADWTNTPNSIRKDLRRLRKLAEQIRDLGDLDAAHREGQLQQLISEATGEELAGNVEPTIPARHRVPVINKVAAGYPSNFTDLDFPARVADEYIACPQIADPDAFAARVVGDSMLPAYREGDLVIFSPAADVTDGSDCFARLEPDHETTFKRVYFEAGDRIRLQPLNEKYDAATHPREKVAGLYRAVWKMSQL